MSQALLFGKLPAHGDFVSRGIGAAERVALDDWLSEQMASARRELGGAFEDNFDKAPPWRFAWREQEGWTAGAMAPSVDSVGRRYPIVIGLRGISAEETSAATEQCEEAAYSALGEAWTADRAIAAVSARAPLAGDGADQDCWWTLGSSSFPPARLPGRTPRELLLTMLTKTEPMHDGE